MAKKQLYRLQVLLRIKEKVKKKAEIVLAKAIKNLEEEKEKLKRLHEVKQKIIENRKRVQTNMRNHVASGQARIKESQYHLGYVRKLDEDEESIDKEIKEQEEAVELAKQKLKRARRDYIDAATELNIMEQHKELWVKKQERALSALENKQMNELGNTVHQMNKMRAA